MPFVLTVKEGDRIAVGESVLKVGEVRGDGSTSLWSEEEGLDIRHDRSIEVAYDVYVSLGDAKRSQAKLVFEAPREVTIEMLK